MKSDNFRTGLHLPLSLEQLYTPTQGGSGQTLAHIHSTLALAAYFRCVQRESAHRDRQCLEIVKWRCSPAGSRPGGWEAILRHLPVHPFGLQLVMGKYEKSSGSACDTFEAYARRTSPGSGWLSANRWKNMRIVPYCNAPSPAGPVVIGFPWGGRWKVKRKTLGK